MSHFSVLVIGDDVEQQLAPFHEYECTGHFDEYVVPVSELEETLEKYNSDDSVIDGYVMPDGTFEREFSDNLYRPATDAESEEIKTNRSNPFNTYSGLNFYSGRDENGNSIYKVRDPEFFGAKAESRKVSEAQSFLEFFKYEHGEYDVISEPIDFSNENWRDIVSEMGTSGGIICVDESTEEVLQAVRFTNPNSKWDWYSIGGRWSNALLKKDGTSDDECLLSELDIDGMLNGAKEEALNSFDQYIEKYGQFEEGFKLFDLIKKEIEEANPQFSMDDVRNAYGAQPLMQEYTKENEFPGVFSKCPARDYLAGRGLSIEERRDIIAKNSMGSALPAYSMVKNQTWISRGNMGWFGLSDDKVSLSDWGMQVVSMLKELQNNTETANTLITVVDCHI